MVVEESALIDGDALQEIIIPMMNIDRRDALGRVVPGETNQQQTYITTAGSKTCFMYQKLIEMTAMECLRPQDYFVWGMDYRVPVYHGLLSKQFLDEQRMSTTFNEEAFARESMSINQFRWTLKLLNCWNLLEYYYTTIAQKYLAMKVKKNNNMDNQQPSS